MPNIVQNILEWDLKFTMSNYSKSKRENFSKKKINFVRHLLLVQSLRPVFFILILLNNISTSHSNNYYPFFTPR